MSVPEKALLGHGLGFSPRPVPREARFRHGLGISPRYVPAEARFGHCGKACRKSYSCVLAVLKYICTGKI